MSIAVLINASFNIDNTTYTTNLELPTSASTATAPFLFNVTAQPQGATTVTTMLTVAVGTTNEIYIAVAPPSY